MKGGGDLLVVSVGFTTFVEVGWYIEKVVIVVSFDVQRISKI